MLKPIAPYMLSQSEFYIFAATIGNLQTPSRHVSLMGQYIKECFFGGVKSHDYHVLTYQFLPLALCGLLTTRLWMVVMRIFKIFRWICNKVWYPSGIESLRTSVVVSFALVEMHFSPSFFDIMTHLLYHQQKMAISQLIPAINFQLQATFATKILIVTLDKLHVTLVSRK